MVYSPPLRLRPDLLPYTLTPSGLRRIRWNNVPYHEGRTVFLINPKCANSAVKMALLEARGLAEGGAEHRRSETWSPAEAARSGYRCVAVVRNPYARAVSIWHSKIHRRGKSGLTRFPGIAFGQSFVEFLRAVQSVSDYPEMHVRSQWLGMYHRRRFLPDRVIKVEEPQGWEELRRDLPALPALPRRNVSDAPDWRALCTGEARDLILRRWGRDFDVFGYER